MKAIQLLALFCLFIVVNEATAQEKREINLADSTGLPGDNFSLQGALGLFKESKSLEDFEKKLNTKENDVNNLDLNGDGKIDYVRVVDVVKDDAHAIVLQIPVSKTETQDVAVIELEKNGESSAMVQIIGDEQLYAENTIVEPAEINEPGDKGNTKRGPSTFSHGSIILVNVWGWPCVRFLYAPVYVAWVSPWYWGFYPSWWSPWPPYPWRWHYMSSYHFHHHYHYAPFHRTTYAHGIYAPRRSHSAQVTERYRDNHVRYNAAHPRQKNLNQGRPAQNLKPGSRTPSKPAIRDGGQTRPGTKTLSRPSSRPSVKPAKPSGRPQAKPAPAPGRNQQMKPSGRPAPNQLSRPSNQSRPSGRQR